MGIAHGKAVRVKGMKVKRISIYNEFQCIGAECPVNCCKGWRVPLDEEVCQKYLLEKGDLGVRLRRSIRNEEGIPAFRRNWGKCPFWGKDRLCSLQKERGAAFMPQVCVQFPRQLFHLGFFCEETLYLACPEAARLFLVQAGQGKHFFFEESEEDVAYKVNTTNDDADFLDYLLMAREQLVGMLDGASSYNSVSILEYGRNAQSACLSGSKLPAPLEYANCSTKHFALDCTDFNRLFFHGFYHPYLRSHSPFLHRLCQKYIRELGIPGRINRRSANEKLVSLKAGLYLKIPELDRLLDRYYEYELLTGFLNIFEDYSFSKHLLWGMAKTEMLWLFLALYAKNKEKITEAEIANILAVFERRAPQMAAGFKSISGENKMHFLAY